LALAQEKWELIKQVCKQKSFSAAALLNHAHPVLLEPGEMPVLVVQAEFPFHQQKLREPNQRGAVEWAIEQVLELPMRIKVVLTGNSDTGGAEGARPGDGPGGGGGSVPTGSNRINGKGASPAPGRAANAPSSRAPANATNTAFGSTPGAIYDAP